METPSNLSKSKFTETLIRANGLERQGFVQWVFEPAMLFNAQHTWWTDRQKRKTPHEGLDLCLFRDQSGSINRLHAGTSIPAVDDGVVIKIFEDFLGRSLFIEQTASSDKDSTLLVFYGHTIPRHDLQVGQQVKGGDLIADIAAPESTILPHLHISLGWIPRPVDHDSLDWETIGKRNMVTLIDPVEFLDWNYEIMESAATFSEGQIRTKPVL